MTGKRRIPFKLHELRGVDPEAIGKLATYGIKHVEQMLVAAHTKPQRTALATATGLPKVVES